MTTQNTIRYDELALIIVLGALQPATELLFGTRIAALYNVAAALVVVAWIAFRLAREKALVHAWGLRRDNFVSSLKIHGAFAFLAAEALYAWGWLHDRTPLPSSFWFLLFLYPVWGFAQQFALQNFVARNLTGLCPNVFMRSLATAALFSLAHAPSMDLMILAFVAGFFFTLLYHRSPNLFAIGIAHGIVGALVFYLVLDQNQMDVLRGYID